MNQAIDISGYLVARFRADYRNNNWRFDCPFCGADKQRFSVSIFKGITHCWKCDYTKSIIQFVQDVEDIGLAEAFQTIKRYYSVKYVKKKVIREKPTAAQLTQRFKSYKFISELKKPSYSQMLAIKYLNRRGLNERSIKLYNLGFLEEYPGYIISPFIESGLVVYFVARKFTGYGTRYNNPKLEDWGIGKSELLYNNDSAVEYSSEGINIVEGVYDVYATGRNSVGLLGKSISSIQLSKVIMMNPTSIKVMLDSDAKDNAFALADRLAPLFPTKVVLYKKGDPSSNQAAHSNNKEEVQYSFRALIRNKLNTTE